MMVTGKTERFVSIFLIALMLLSLVSLALPHTSAGEKYLPEAALSLEDEQYPEPPSPEEEWYPPVPAVAQQLPGVYGFSTVTPSGATTALTARLLDLNLNPRREFYRGDGMVFEFSTRFSSFLLWIYEWYPPGNVPRGHWLLWAVGPFTGGGTYRIAPFLPEPTEPEGPHTWKCWLLDIPTWTWATCIIRFDFREHPRPTILNVDILPEMKVNKQYTITVTIQNTGEKRYTYVVSVGGTGFTVSPPSTTSIVNAGGTVSLTFKVTPTISGTLSLTVDVKADSRIYDSKTFTINVKALKPSHTLSPQNIPEGVKLGENVPINVLFINTGEGTAKQVTLSISSAEGVSLVKGLDSIPEIPAGGSHTFSLIVKPESGGVKTLTLTLEYLDEEGNRYHDSIAVSFSVLVPLRISTMTKRHRPISVQFSVGEKQYSGSYEGWVSFEPIQVSVPGEWEISDGTKAEFMGWSDGNPSPTRTVQITTPMELVAEYRLKHHLKVTADIGSPTGTGWYYEGETVSISIKKLIEGEEGVRYVFVEWSDGVKDPRRTIIVNKPMNIHAKYKTQYYLAVISDYSKTHGSGWYDEGSSAMASIDETVVDIGFPYIMVFKGWSGDASGKDSTSNPVIMDSPKKAIAIWEKQITPTFYALIAIIVVVIAVLTLTIKFKGKLFKAKAGRSKESKKSG